MKIDVRATTRYVRVAHLGEDWAPRRAFVMSVTAPMPTRVASFLANFLSQRRFCLQAAYQRLPHSSRQQRLLRHKNAVGSSFAGSLPAHRQLILAADLKY